MPVPHNKHSRGYSPASPQSTATEEGSTCVSPAPHHRRHPHRRGARSSANRRATAHTAAEAFTPPTFGKQKQAVDNEPLHTTFVRWLRQPRSRKRRRSYKRRGANHCGCGGHGRWRAHAYSARARRADHRGRRCYRSRRCKENAQRQISPSLAFQQKGLMKSTSSDLFASVSTYRLPTLTGDIGRNRAKAVPSRRQAASPYPP